MRTIVKGKNIDVPESVRLYADRKMRRLERYLDDRTDATIELSVERHRSADDSRIAELTLVIDGQALHGRAEAATYEAAIDEVVDKGERRAVDHREKPRVRARAPEEKGILARIADGTAEPGRERRVVKTKRFGIEPMFEEDAIAEMESLGTRSSLRQRGERTAQASTGARDGDFGLIEPVIAGEYTPGRARSRAARRDRARVDPSPSRPPGPPERYDAGRRCPPCHGPPQPRRPTLPTVPAPGLPAAGRSGAHLPLGDGMVVAVERATSSGGRVQVFADNPTAWEGRAAPRRSFPAFPRPPPRLASGPSPSTLVLVNLAGPDDDCTSDRWPSSPRADGRPGYGARFVNVPWEPQGRGRAFEVAGSATPSPRPRGLPDGPGAPLWSSRTRRGRRGGAPAARS